MTPVPTPESATWSAAPEGAGRGAAVAEAAGAARFGVFRPRSSGAWRQARDRLRERLRPPAAAARPRRAPRERAARPAAAQQPPCAGDEHDRDQADRQAASPAAGSPGASPGAPRPPRHDLRELFDDLVPGFRRVETAPLQVGPVRLEDRPGIDGERVRVGPYVALHEGRRRQGPRGRSAPAPRGGASGCAWPRRCSRASPRPPRAPAGAGLRSRPCLHRDVAVEAAGACRRKSFVRVRTYKPEASAAGVARLISPRPFFASSSYSSPASSTNVSPSSLSR